MALASWLGGNMEIQLSRLVQNSETRMLLDLVSQS